jgi:hypothetical protein
MVFVITQAAGAEHISIPRWIHAPNVYMDAKIVLITPLAQNALSLLI